MSGCPVAADAGIGEAELQFLDLLPDALLVVGGDGRVLEANVVAQELFGYSRAELVGASVEDLLPERLRLRHTAYRQAFQAAPYRRPMGKSLDLRARRRDGTEIPVEISLGPVKGRGAGVVLAAVRDISSRRRAEEALRTTEQLYRAVVETSPDAIELVAADGRIKYASPSVAAIVGRPAPELIGRMHDEALHPDDRQRFDERWADCLANTAATSRGQFRYLRADGTVRHVDVVWVNHLQTPALVAVVTHQRDVSETKELEEQLRHAQKMDAIGRLAGGIAHDFNNLLTAIAGFGTVILEGLDATSPIRGDMEDIMSATRRAAALTRQLLAFGRRQVLQARVLSVPRQLREMQRMLPPLIGERVQLVTELHDGVSPVLADPGQLEQIIVNLVVNARDAMPKGGRVTITVANAALDHHYVQTHPDVAPGDYVCIAVSDTGTGIDPALSSRVFEPFFTTKGPGRGTGLGLATVFGIVKQSAGHVSFHSELGVGTTFNVYLPAVVQAAPAPAPSVADPQTRGSETILLVEDEELVRRFIKRLLVSHGYKVVSAGNAAEAIAIAAREPGRLHLLLTDIIMPGLSGPELARRLASMRPELRVLFMSGYPGDAAALESELHAGIALIENPPSIDALLKAIRQALESPAPTFSAATVGSSAR